MLVVEGGFVYGDIYGMFWLCWGMLEMKYFGIYIFYDILKIVVEGGGNFCICFGVEFEGKSLLVEDSYLKGCEL